MRPSSIFPLLLLAAGCASTAAAESISTNWTPLFNGRSLDGWSITDFAGHGAVAVKDGKISLEPGVAMTGVNYTNALPTMNYEVRVEAQKVQGGDFFSALTFPVGDSHCTLIPGGWGGSLVGLSSIDGADASENETTTFQEFKPGEWHVFRVRVTDGRIQAFINNDRVANVVTTDRKVSLRPGDIERSIPLGLAAYQTESEIRKVEIRKLAPGEPAIPQRKVVFIAGKKSHGPGEHDYEAGLRLLQQNITTLKLEGVQSELHTNGWPADPATLNTADTIVLYSDGADHNRADHPLLVGDRLAQFSKQMERGAGFVAIHYTVILPTDLDDKFKNWLGGYFDYETGPAPRKWFSKIETKEFQVYALTPTHPVSAGVSNFTIREEFYFNLQFPDPARGWRPILSLSEDRSDKTQAVAWVQERENGGRSFGYTGGHFHANWQNERVRRMLVNAILWTAKAEVPPP